VIGRLHTTTFQAMGTACAISATARGADRLPARRALLAATAEVEACERALSRFDPTSDLSRLNRAAGEWVAIDERLERALHTALRVRTETSSRFDPTILPALVAAGYDRSFEQLDERPARPATGWRAGAAIDLAPGRARIERGAAVDLGGIGKGFSAERALAAMHGAWSALPGAIVDLGGDVATAGTPPDRGPWRIAIADPSGRRSALGTLLIDAGGVATSGRNARRFGPSRTLHHLIDPSTGAPASAGPLAVTVVARDATDAEGHATALAISSLADARAHIARHPEIAALFVDAAGGVHAIGALPLATMPPQVAGVRSR
jgi:thiamine biosynthesis lipoprotein